MFLGANNTYLTNVCRKSAKSGANMCKLKNKEHKK